MRKSIRLWPLLLVLAACASTIEPGEWYVAYDRQTWGKLGTTSAEDVALDRCLKAGLVMGRMENFYGARNGVRFYCKRI
jgi:hypothetical protein